MTEPATVTPAVGTRAAVVTASRAVDLGQAAALAVATLAWWHFARRLDVTAVGDAGTATSMTPAIWGAYAVVVAGLILALRRDAATWVLAAHVVVLVLMLYGVDAVTGLPARNPVAWRHAGLVDSFLTDGVVDTRLDAYYSWPGFFMSGAALARFAGLGGVVPLLSWAPVAFELLYLPPLLMLGRALTPTRRSRWAAAAVFYLANWVNQDYFSPQALAFLLYLGVLALLVSYLRAAGPAEPNRLHTRIRTWWRGRRRSLLGPLPPGPRTLTVVPLGYRPGNRPGTAAGLLALRAEVGVLMVVLAGFVATTATHQLTPIALICATTVAGRWLRPRLLPLLFALIELLWLLFPAFTFVKGHLPTLLGGVGNVGATADQGVGARFSGTTGHILTVDVRVATTVLVVALAVAGFVIASRRRVADPLTARLAVAPGLLLAVQPYGGEVVMRSYLFALPFLAMLAVRAMPRLTGELEPLSGYGVGGVAAGRVAALACVLLVLGLVARYGNDRIDQPTRAEQAAIATMYAMAPPGAAVVTAANYLPWRYVDYRSRPAITLLRHWPKPYDGPTAERIAVRTLREHPGSMLVLTRSEENYVSLLGLLPQNALPRLERMLRADPAVRVAYANADAVVFTAVQGGG